MKDKTMTILLIAATLIIALFIGVCHLQNDKINQLREIINKADTTTTILHDTVYQTQIITDTVPKLKVVRVYNTDTITLYKDTVPHILTLQTKQYENTITNDGDTTTYNAYVTGYDVDDQNYPTLDSIKLRTSHRIINTTETIIIEKKVPQKANSLVITPSVGYGYGLLNKQTDVYLGITLGWNIFRK